jgi:hypothetical protein
MTLRTFSLSGARLKLAFVRIRLMAVHAICERKRLLEIAVDVTRDAVYRSVFAEQRVLRLGVIERKGL